MVTVKVNGEEQRFPKGTTFETVAKEYQNKFDAPIFIAIENGKIRELFKEVKKDNAEVSFLTMRDKIGHSTYVRSATLLLVKAVADVIGDIRKGKIKVEFSLAQGYYCSVKGDFKVTEEFIEKVNTGAQKKKYSIDFLGKKINLFLKEEPKFKVYEKTESVKEYSAFKNIFPSVYIKTTLYKEQLEKKVKLTENQAFEKAKKELSEEMKKSISKETEIRNISAKYEKIDEKSIKVTVNFELRENIAEERAIDKIENLNYDIVGSE